MKTLVILIALLCTPVLYADTLVQHVQNQADNNAMYHDSVPGENVFMHTGRLGPIQARLAARIAWRNSDGHRQNLRRTLPLLGVAVRRSDNATYVTSRAGLFPRR